MTTSRQALLVVFLFAAPALASDVLDRPAKIEPDFRGDFIAVCKALSVGCGVESVADDHHDLPKEGHSNRETPRQVLDDYVRAHPGTSWMMENGAIDLLPSLPVEGDPLSRKIDHISLHGITGFLAMGEVFAKAKIPVSCQIMGRRQVYKPVQLDLKDVSVRQALNTIAHADGEMMWVVAHFPKSQLSTKITFTTGSWRKVGIAFSDDERKRFAQLWKRN